MTGPNPLHLANTAQNMARSASGGDAAVFNKVAMVCMGVMSAASAVQMLQPFLSKLNHTHSSRTADNRGRHR